MTMHTNMSFVKGMGMGLIVGSAVGAAVAAPKKNGGGSRSVVSKALKTIGEVIDDIGNVLD